MVVIEQEGDIDLAFSAYMVLFDIVYLQRSPQTILPKTLLWTNPPIPQPYNSLGLN